MIFGDEHLIELDRKTYSLLEQLEGMSKYQLSMGRKLIVKQSMDLLNKVVKICWEKIEIAIERKDQNAKQLV